MAALGAPITATVDITLPPAEIPPPPTAPALSAELIPPPAAPPPPPAPATEAASPTPSPAAAVPPPLVILPLPDMPPSVALSAEDLQLPPPPQPVAPAPSADAGPGQPAASQPARPPGTFPPPPAPAPVSLPGPDCSVIIQTALEGDRILFDYWKAEKRAEHEAVLDRLAAAIRRCEPTERIEVAGHADIHNRTNQNQQLSEDRASLMRDELVRRGVPAEMLVVVGYAETRPVVPNDTDANRALNRRVEFHVLPRR
jgi:outer membrane protein OmpA-like peptidoglycan-associated protein